MESQIITLSTAIVGLLIGFFLCWLMLRSRSVVVADAAFERGKAETQIELASAKERARSLEEDVRRTESQFSQLQAQANQQRDTLDLVRDEKAQLAERASRVPTLEGQLQESQAKAEQDQSEILRLSKLAAEKGQAFDSASARLTEVENGKAKLDEEHASTVKLLQEANERRATLDSENSRIPGIESKLNDSEAALTVIQRQAADLREESGRIVAELKAERDALASVKFEIQTEKADREKADAQVAKLTTELAEMSLRLTSEQEQSGEKLALLLQAKEALTDQFKNLANDILEEKSKRFSEQNQTSLGLLLDPLKLKISEFQTKVDDVYVKEGKDRTALAEQVRQLMDLNQVLSEDAKNLTRALKGSSKTQGNWGELVLERVLEASGLRKGEEYHVQESHTREDGSRAQPDVVIHLPEDRHLVVDAKVSLTAYEDFANQEDDTERQAAVKRHMDSIRNHMKGLSDKNYQTLYGLKSLDFVLMFVPIEPAFMLAVSHDKDLFMDAWQRNVLLVSPSTLLFVVRTVAHLWRQEAQNRNAQDIAKRGAELYDKFVGFVVDMESLGNRIKQAQEDYDSAHKKLTSGRGNLIGQAEKLRDLGVKPTKAIPPTLLELAQGDAPLLAAN